MKLNTVAVGAARVGLGVGVAALRRVRRAGGRGVGQSNGRRTGRHGHEHGHRDGGQLARSGRPAAWVQVTVWPLTAHVQPVPPSPRRLRDQVSGNVSVSVIGRVSSAPLNVVVAE